MHATTNDIDGEVQPVMNSKQLPVEDERRCVVSNRDHVIEAVAAGCGNEAVTRAKLPRVFCGGGVTGGTDGL